MQPTRHSPGGRSCRIKKSGPEDPPFNVAIRLSYLFIRFSIRSSTTDGSASVEVSPSAP